MSTNPISMVSRFVNTGATVRGLRVVKRTALVTDANGEAQYSIEEATDGTVGGGYDLVEGIVRGSPDESLTPTTTGGEPVDVVVHGIFEAIAGAVMDPATVEWLTFDLQGRVTAATLTTHRRIGRLLHHKPTVTGERCKIFVDLTNGGE